MFCNLIQLTSSYWLYRIHLRCALPGEAFTSFSSCLPACASVRILCCSAFCDKSKCETRPGPLNLCIFIAIQSAWHIKTLNGHSMDEHISQKSLSSHLKFLEVSSSCYIPEHGRILLFPMVLKEENRGRMRPFCLFEINHLISFHLLLPLLFSLPLFAWKRW